LTFPHLFPSSPPGSFFKSDNNQAWIEHYQKLENHFSGFLFTLIFARAQIIEKWGKVDYFCFFARMDEKS
jgi:hypothetical protein